MEKVAVKVMLIAACLLVPGLALAQTKGQFRVCADPENMPFSNRKQEGFENKIADVIAREFHAATHYTWWGQRRGFIRNTMNATLQEGRCDVVIAVPPKTKRQRRREMAVADPLFDALREARRTLAAEAGVPAYVIFHDSTLREIAAARPTSLAELAQVNGVGRTKLERYGGAMLAAVESAR